MSWTEDRVSLLKKLWGDGHTAAEIAKQLGGVTRNAVIGKAHRLKLSNRVSPIQQNKKVANKNVKRKKIEKSSVSVASERSEAASLPKRKPILSDEIPSGKLYSLTELQPRMCRWPCGDPRDEAFGFCGDKTVSGIPYCAEHAKVAYQPATRNRILNAEKEAEKMQQALEKAEKKQAAQ